MLKLRDGQEIGDYELGTILPTQESRAMVRCRSTELTVRVVCIRLPDSERRVCRAINLLLAAAQPDEDSDNNNGSKNQGKAPAGNEYQGDSTDTG